MGISGQIEKLNLSEKHQAVLIVCVCVFVYECTHTHTHTHTHKTLITL